VSGETIYSEETFSWLWFKRFDEGIKGNVTGLQIFDFSQWDLSLRSGGCSGFMSLPAGRQGFDGLVCMKKY
jgi:hypothetical protein